MSQTLIVRSSLAEISRDRLDGDQHAVEPDGLVIDVGVVLELGIDGNEIVVAVDLDAVARIVDHGDVGAAGLGAEIAQGSAHVLGRKVVARLDDGEAGLLEGLGQEVGIVGGIGKARRALIGRIAHDQRHALVGKRCGRLEDKRQCAEKKQVKKLHHGPQAGICNSCENIRPSPQNKLYLGLSGVSGGCAALRQESNRLPVRRMGFVCWRSICSGSRPATTLRAPSQSSCASLK